MNVQHQRSISDGHSVEIGAATWNAQDRSVRNRYQTATGGFSPHSSSEVPMGDLVPILRLVAEHDELSASECAQIISALAESIVRQASTS